VSLVSFAASAGLLLLLSAMPRYYERVQFIEALLPVIHSVLGLRSTARLTVHHVRSIKRQTYEQLVDYFPARSGRGRVFVFTQGITGHAFRTSRSQVYSIPDGKTIAEDHQSRWSFTQDEISRLAQDRRSYYVYPIGNARGFARAVLFCDSADPSEFTADRKEQLDQLLRSIFQPILERLMATDTPGPAM
jgi:hypothetical protein